MSSSISSVDEARRALGNRLRELRRRAGCSGKEFAEALSWAGSKVSKIEHGRQSPTDRDIRAWAVAARTGDQTESLLAALRHVELQHAEWQRLLKAGAASHPLSLCT
jgi:transcriptional regulator with XRE-family HTH domain